MVEQLFDSLEVWLVPQVPRIRRAQQSGDAFRPVRPVPVTATIVWHDGTRDPTAALAVAWTSREVEVQWTTPWGDRRTDWIPADHVRRR